MLCIPFVVMLQVALYLLGWLVRLVCVSPLYRTFVFTSKMAVMTVLISFVFLKFEDTVQPHLIFHEEWSRVLEVLISAQFPSLLNSHHCLSCSLLHYLQHAVRLLKYGKANQRKLKCRLVNVYDVHYLSALKKNWWPVCHLSVLSL